MTEILEQVAQLSVEEKIILVERIWDDIADDNKTQELPISTELETELSRRLALLQNGETELLTWAQVQHNIFSNYPPKS